MSRCSPVFTLVVLLALATVADACPNCKETIAGDPAQQGLVKGIYFSILFMMSAPFFILGGICSYFYYLVRRERARQSSIPGSFAVGEEAVDAR